MECASARYLISCSLPDMRPGYPARSADEHGCSDGDPVVEVDDVGDVHADAAMRGARADRPILGRAVDADAVGDTHPARLERVVRAAAGDRLTGERACPRAVGHVPGGVHLLVLDAVEAGRRLEAGHADGDAVALPDAQVL